MKLHSLLSSIPALLALTSNPSHAKGFKPQDVESVLQQLKIETDAAIKEMTVAFSTQISYAETLLQIADTTAAEVDKANTKTVEGYTASLDIPAKIQAYHSLAGWTHFKLDEVYRPAVVALGMQGSILKAVYETEAFLKGRDLTAEQVAILNAIEDVRGDAVAVVQRGKGYIGAAIGTVNQLQQSLAKGNGRGGWYQQAGAQGHYYEAPVQAQNQNENQSVWMDQEFAEYLKQAVNEGAHNHLGFWQGENAYEPGRYYERGDGKGVGQGGMQFEAEAGAGTTDTSGQSSPDLIAGENW